MTKRIIIAEDAETMRRMYLIALRLGGDKYDIKEAKDGVEALDIIKADGNPDLLSTDINMPRMDGYELIEELERRGNKHPIVIVSSGFSAERIKYSGRLEYIPKPINMVNYIKKIEELLA